MNELKNELYRSQSPYLLQHMDNPVAWQIWSKSAFEEAKIRNVPVLVSVGYSTCHWCHVMAHEIFEKQEIASLMNAKLVCIKVDREENPEIDEIYMEACQSMNGSGGWPLNVFTDHEGKPFFATTYQPPKQWIQLVNQISKAWKENQMKISQFSGEMAQILREVNNDDSQQKALDPFQILNVFLTDTFDSADPDFSPKASAPRFPSHTLYQHLLGYRSIPSAIAQRLEMVLETLQDSGLHDRIGGGFHRYSTDSEWRVPHFEKMLYDNAQLMAVFAMASGRYSRPDFMATAENIARYLKRDMSVFKDEMFAGYASAEDADDPGGEGSFYAWTSESLEKIVGAEEGKKLTELWDIRNEEYSAHGIYPFRIPHPRGSKKFREASWEEKMNMRMQWNQLCEPLLAKRSSRPRPFRDEKVLTDWNALILYGLSVLYAHKPLPEYRAMLEACASIVLDRIHQGTIERLPGVKGHLTDYGHTALALFTAWEVTGEEIYVKKSLELVNAALKMFTDANDRIFTSDDYASIFMRYEEKSDHAQPAGAHSLLLAATRLQNSGYRNEITHEIFNLMQRRKRLIAPYAPMAAGFLSALNELEHGPVTLTLPADFRNRYPDLLKWTGSEVRIIGSSAMHKIEYCEKDRCLLPAASPEELEDKLSYAWIKPH